MNEERARMSIFRPTGEEGKYDALLKDDAKLIALGKERVEELRKEYDEEAFVKKKKRFHFVHYFFKPKMLIPFIKVGEKVLGSYLIKKRQDIPNLAENPHNKNFVILWDSFQENYKDWWFTFKGVHILQARKDELKSKGLALEPDHERKLQCLLNEWDHNEQSREANWFRFPQFFLRFALSHALEDTAYRELLNMFLFRLQANMNKEYNPEVQHRFPLYISSQDGHLDYHVDWMMKNNKQLGFVVVEQDEKIKLIKINKDILPLIQHIQEAYEKKYVGKLVLNFEKQEEQDEGEKEECGSSTPNKGGVGEGDKGQAGTVHPGSGALPRSGADQDRSSNETVSTQDQAESVKECERRTDF